MKRPARSKAAAEAADVPPDAELEALACLWDRGEATARQVREMMAPYRPMTHGSAVTLLKRLQARGLVTRQKGSRGKAFIYHPTRCARPTHRRIIRDLVRRVFRGNGVQMVSTFLDAQPPTPQELDRLEQLLKELRAKTDRRRDTP